MKYVKQFGIILLISVLGEILHEIIPLPIPASIYGIIILFFCLELKLLSVSSIKETSAFLLEIMPLMFIPAAVGLMDAWDILLPSLLAYIVITLVSTFIVMAAAGRVTQALMLHKKRKEVKSHE